MLNRSKISYYLKWLDYYLLLRVCSLLPLKLAYACARFRARYRMSVRHDTREAARKNMSEFLPGLDQTGLERHVREFFYGPCLDELEGYFIPKLNAHNLGRFMDVAGQEHLDCCLDRGRGAIVFSTHSAGVALCLVALGLLGYTNNVVGRSLDQDENPLHPALRSYARWRVKCIETKLGRPFLEPARGNSTVLADRLRANELVFILLDVPPEIVRQKVVVSFLGRDCIFPSGFAQLATQTGCGLVPVEKFYEPTWSRQRLVFGKAIYPTGNIHKDVQYCVAVIEQMIYKHPSQWYVWDNLPMFWESNSLSHGDTP